MNKLLAIAVSSFILSSSVVANDIQLKNGWNLLGVSWENSYDTKVTPVNGSSVTSNGNGIMSVVDGISSFSFTKGTLPSPLPQASTQFISVGGNVIASISFIADVYENKSYEIVYNATTYSGTFIASGYTNPTELSKNIDSSSKSFKLSSLNISSISEIQSYTGSGWNVTQTATPEMFWGVKNLIPSFGYWVKATEATTISLNGPEIKTINFNEGWNLVATPTIESLANSNSLIANISEIQKYTGSGWNVTQTATPEMFWGIKSLNSGDGYWVKSNKKFTFNLNSSGDEKVFSLTNDMINNKIFLAKDDTTTSLIYINNNKIIDLGKDNTDGLWYETNEFTIDKDTITIVGNDPFTLTFTKEPSIGDIVNGKDDIGSFEDTITSIYTDVSTSTDPSIFGDVSVELADGTIVEMYEDGTYKLSIQNYTEEGNWSKEDNSPIMKFVSSNNNEFYVVVPQVCTTQPTVDNSSSETNMILISDNGIKETTFTMSLIVDNTDDDLETPPGVPGVNTDKEVVSKAKTQFDQLSTSTEKRSFVASSGVVVSFNDDAKPTATTQEQTYDVVVTFTKNNESVTSTFTEIVEAIKDIENPPGVPELTNKQIVDAVAARLDDDTDTTIIDLLRTGNTTIAGVTITYHTTPPAATAEDQTYDADITLSKGDYSVESGFDGVVAADAALKAEAEAKEAAKKAAEAKAAQDALDKSAVDAVAAAIKDRTLPNDLKGTAVSFDPAQAKTATSEDQTYTVNVTITKGTQSTTASFEETVAATQTSASTYDSTVNSGEQIDGIQYNGAPAKISFDTLNSGENLLDNNGGTAGLLIDGNAIGAINFTTSYLNTNIEVEYNNETYTGTIIVGAVELVKKTTTSVEKKSYDSTVNSGEQIDGIQYNGAPAKISFDTLNSGENLLDNNGGTAGLLIDGNAIGAINFTTSYLNTNLEVEYNNETYTGTIIVGAVELVKK